MYTCMQWLTVRVQCHKRRDWSRCLVSFLAAVLILSLHLILCSEILCTLVLAMSQVNSFIMTPILSIIYSMASFGLGNQRRWWGLDRSWWLPTGKLARTSKPPTSSTEHCAYRSWSISGVSLSVRGFLSPPLCTQRWCKHFKWVYSIKLEY